MSSPLPSILVIDDDASICHSLGRLLKRLGWEAYFALDGETGLREFEARKPGFVLLDLNLPQGSGREILKSIKDRAPESKVIMFTGEMTGPLEAELTQAGAFALLPKPFETAELLKLLK